ncbi:MAG: nucleotidyltransferase family protein [Actinobacteria bacterium]|nr:nucleotidyltransferase family protein [Actinomycetota bacterium]
MTTAAVLLAAGLGTRFDGPTPKLLAPFRGRRVVDWAVAAAVDAALDETIVVTGTVPARDLHLPGAVTVVHNAEPGDGQASSVQVALAHARTVGHSAVVVGLADQPLVLAEAWRRVAAERSRAIAVATYGGRRGNPVRLAADVWPMLPATGDAAGRAVMAEHPELVVAVPCPGDPADIDTVEDLARWSRIVSSPATGPRHN